MFVRGRLQIAAAMILCALGGVCFADDWASYGGTRSEQRYSTLSDINSANVTSLAPAWYFDLDTTRGQESTPIVIDGVMYVTTAWSKVYALDAKTGKQIWFYDPQVPGSAGVKPCCDVVNRGAAVADGKVFFGTVDGRLIALDARSGKLRWSTLTVDPKRMHTITGAPRVARGKVFIGNGGGEFGGRGYVSAYDTATGKLVWRFYTVPGDPTRPADRAASDEVLEKIARPTWFGPWSDYRGGGQVWNAIVFDAELNHLYIATGNGFPTNRTFRSAGQGDNLFISSVIALDADTGKYVWHYQETPGESWDYDSVQDMILAELPVNGARRKVLLHAPKNGFFYVLDRASGQLLSAEPYVPGISWARRVDLTTGKPEIAPDAHYENGPFLGSPGEGGAHNWQPPAFSPQTGLVYLSASENSTLFAAPAKYQYVEGVDGVGYRHDLLPGSSAPHGAAPMPKSYLLAWDPVAGKPRWRADVRGGGVLATAGNLVFQGASRDGPMGQLVALDATTGARLWSARTPNAIMQGPVTYRVGGEQYVAATSGAGGAGIIFGAEPARVRQVGRVVAFKLGGSASLPEDPPFAAAPNPPSDTWPASAVAEGKRHYDAFCWRCHGIGMRAANIIPDLRRSAALADKDAWNAIVIGGALETQGMVGWGKHLTAVEAENIRAYVADEARALRRDIERPGCDKACLEAIAEQYRTAYLQHNAGKASIAATVCYTENGVEMKFPDGSWDTVTEQVVPALTVSDPTTGNVGMYTAIMQNDTPGFLAIRLKVRDGSIVEIEHVLSTRRTLSGPPTPIGDVRAFKRDPDLARSVPHDQRMSRQQLIDLADGYFSTLEHNTGEIRGTRFAKHAVRIENGMAFPDIEGGFRLGRYRFNERVRDRDYFLVDEERGIVMCRAFIDHKGLLDEYTLTDGTKVHSPFREPHTWAVLELFKIKGGSITGVEATFIGAPYYMRSPWTVPTR